MMYFLHNLIMCTKGVSAGLLICVAIAAAASALYTGDARLTRFLIFDKFVYAAMSIFLLTFGIMLIKWI